MDTSAAGFTGRLFTIPPTRPFLDVLARALVSGRLVPGFSAADPLALSTATILVPTRRAARALQLALMEAMGTSALLLPRIRPIGDVDDDPLDLVEPQDDDGPVAMAPFARHLALTRLVLAWKRSALAKLLHPVTGREVDMPATPAEAVHLAKALMTLMDQVATEGLDWSGLAGLAPEDHARYWELTLAFLEIVAKAWPDFLKDKGLEDPGRRRDRLIRREAERLEREPPAGPMIVAGSTGSVPATAALIRAISRLEKGAVVLPGLDLWLDDASWTAIGTRKYPTAVSHPQYGLKLLLERLDADRIHVESLEDEADEALAARLKIVSHAMRPAETAQDWVNPPPDYPTPETQQEALAGLMLLEARNETEEALAIAVALREAIHQEKTAALVTPDRVMARRVSAELRRFGLDVDDSAGQPLGATVPATLARLAADLALGDFDAIDLAGLLHHPLARFGASAEVARHRARALEILVLRGPRPAPGIAGLRRALEAALAEREDETARVPLVRRRLSEDDLAAARLLLDELAAALAPLDEISRQSELSLSALVRAHAETIRRIVRDEAGTATALEEDGHGAALVDVLAELSEAAADADADLKLAPGDYPSVFQALVSTRPVRQAGGTETRILILGPLEARLLRFDRLILGGLVDGVWPAAATTDPWMSRPMKATFGLEPPERRIGLAAHDVCQGLGANEVILTRPLKLGGAPTVPSRWLQRLQAVIGASAVAALRARAAPYLRLAAALDRPAGPPVPVSRPAPMPPVERRPKKLSVTEIETWIRDPYAIHARHILRLEPLEPVAAEPDASERGQIIHEVMSRFVAEARDEADLGDLARFRAVAREELKRIAAFPGLAALWAERLEGIGRWFTTTEPNRQGRLVQRLTEIYGKLEIGQHFSLSGRADRIDLLGDGRIAVIDYKTGAPPSDKQVRTLLSPQLPLEGLMAQSGAFGPDLDGRELAGFVYAHLSGKGEGGSWHEVKTGTAKEPGPSFDELAVEARDRLVRLVEAFRNPATPYPSRPRIAFERDREGPYDHLARVAEWSAGGGDGEGEA